MRIADKAYRSVHEVGEQLTAEWAADGDGKAIKSSELARTLHEIATANGLEF